MLAVLVARNGYGMLVVVWARFPQPKRRKRRYTTSSRPLACEYYTDWNGLPPVDRLEPSPPPRQEMFTTLPTDPVRTGGFHSVIAGTVSSPEFFGNHPS